LIKITQRTKIKVSLITHLILVFVLKCQVSPLVVLVSLWSRFVKIDAIWS